MRYKRRGLTTCKATKATPSTCRDSSTSDGLPQSGRLRPPDRMTTDVLRPLSMTSSTVPHGLLQVPLPLLKRYHLLRIRNGPSKSSSNAPKSGMRQRTISSSSYHMSRSTSISLSFPKRWACVLTRRRPQRLQPLTTL